MEDGAVVRKIRHLLSVLLTVFIMCMGEVGCCLFLWLFLCVGHYASCLESFDSIIYKFCVNLAMSLPPILDLWEGSCQSRHSLDISSVCFEGRDFYLSSAERFHDLQQGGLLLVYGEDGVGSSRYAERQQQQQRQEQHHRKRRQEQLQHTDWIEPMSLHLEPLEVVVQ